MSSIFSKKKNKKSKEPITYSEEEHRRLRELTQGEYEKKTIIQLYLYLSIYLK